LPQNSPQHPTASSDTQEETEKRMQNVEELQRFLYVCGNPKKIKLCVAVWLLFVTLWPQPQHFQRLNVTIRLTIAMATSANDTPEPEESCFSVPIIACLTVHITGKGNKKKTTKKDTKTKEFSHTFSATKSNYLKFLTAVLTKHHIGDKLQVKDRRCYTCKMQVPPSK
jgi:hypothetical protein